MPRGRTLRTPENVALARRMRGEGKLIREIAEHFGCGVSTIGQWFTDPDGQRHVERKRGYQGSCVDCGAPTDGGAGRGRAAKRCATCSTEHIKASAKWTRDAIIAAIRDWADRYGSPPPQTAWLGKHPNRREEDARRFAEGDYPYASQVVRQFGLWANAIEAAGFPRPEVGRYDRAAARVRRRSPGTTPVRESGEG